MKGTKYIEDIVYKIKKQLAVFGIYLNVKVVDFEGFYSNIYHNGEQMRFDMILHAWVGHPFFEKGEMYVSKINSVSNIQSATNNYYGGNVAAYSNAEYDALFEELSVERIYNKRNMVLNKMGHLFIDDAIAIPIYFKTKSLFIKGDIKITTDAFVGNYTNNL